MHPFHALSYSAPARVLTNQSYSDSWDTNRGVSTMYLFPLALKAGINLPSINVNGFIIFYDFTFMMSFILVVYFLLKCGLPWFVSRTNLIPIRGTRTGALRITKSIYPKHRASKAWQACSENTAKKKKR